MDPRVRRTIALMEENLHPKLLLEDLARQVNLSPSRLRHIFKTETGTTLAQYFADFRLQAAREQLETTFLSVKEIGVRVGFKQQSHFIRDFKQAYGLPPARYRMQHAKSASLGEQTSRLSGIAGLVNKQAD